LTLAGHTGAGITLAFTSDSTRLATGSYDHTARIWDLATGQEIQRVGLSGRPVWDVACSPDGEHLATTGDAGMVIIWKAATGQRLVTFSGHTAGVNSVTFSPDGKYMATGSDDHTIRIWEAASGEELYTLYGNEDSVFDVSFSPSSRHLAGAGADGTLRVYSLDEQELMLLARRRVTRPLRPEQCQKYLPLGQCPTLGEPWTGALVTEIYADSAASRAHIQVGDLITKIDGQPVDIWNGLLGSNLLAAYSPGDQIQITYRRGVEVHETDAILGALPDDPEKPFLGIGFRPILTP
jgi:WD40 repeat protein